MVKGIGIPGMKMEKSAKQAFTGGLIGALTNHLEQAAFELVPNYPPFMGDVLTPGLPRNGNLITTAGPFAVGIATQQMKKLKKYNSVGVGLVCYSGPKLLHQLVVWAAYQMGYQNLRSSANLRVAVPPPSLQYPPMGNGSTARIRPQTVYSGGKYSFKAAPTNIGQAGLGKYRTTR